MQFSLVRVFSAFAERINIRSWRICLREIPPELELPVLPDHLEFEILEHTQMRELAGIHSEVSEAFIEHAIELDDSCVVVVEPEAGDTWAEQLVAYSWRTRGTVEFMPTFEVRLNHPETFFGFKTWVDPNVRGLRLFQKMREYLDLRGKPEHRNLGVAYIDVRNHSSWASMARDVNYRQVGFLYHANWGRFSWTLTSSGAKRWVEPVKNPS